MLQNHYEQECWANQELVMGIDEAGRGPLCGPLVVACCVMPLGYQNEMINDSKKLSEKKRKLAFKQIIQDALYYNWRIVEPKVIDSLNIYAATKQAMLELSQEYPDVSLVLTDAMPLHSAAVIPLVKGDALSISIAAASILAKVLRDHIMMGYAILYPEYHYEKHKGYPTKLHLALLEEYGISDIYRLSYSPCKGKKMREKLHK